MKRALSLFLVVLPALLLGCEGSQRDISGTLANANKSNYQIKPGQGDATSPESIVVHLESSRERANYLRGLASDAKFEPKQHVEMLKKYENDPDADVATAAKELLAKAQ
jgi:hypothetical protein